MQKNHQKVLIGFICSIIFLSPAFFNGFPLVYSDTGTYIQSGMDLFIPKDRPVFYGLIIRLFSLKTTLWSVLIFQSLVFTYVLWQISKLINPKLESKQFILISILISSISSVAWYNSQIMPDIFTPICIITSCLLLFHKTFIWQKNIAHIIILCIAVNVHLSNLPILLFSLILSFLILRLIPHLKNLKQNLSFSLVSLSIALSLLLGSISNYFIGGTLKMNNGSHAYLTARMLDTGVLKSFLNDKCSENNYALCQLKDQLPLDSRKFLWDINSPLYELGGWEESKAELNEILTSILLSPKHLLMFIYKSIFSTFSQLFQNSIGSDLISDWYSSSSSPPYQSISKYFYHDLNPYLQSRQNTNLWGQKLDFHFLNKINFLAIILSCIFLFLALLTKLKKHLNDKVVFITYFIITGIVSNAFITASLANTYDRLQSRVSWMLIYLAIILFSVVFKNKIQNLLKVD